METFGDENLDPNTTQGPPALTHKKTSILWDMKKLPPAAIQSETFGDEILDRRTTQGRPVWTDKQKSVIGDAENSHRPLFSRKHLRGKSLTLMHGPIKMCMQSLRTIPRNQLLSG